MGKIRDKIQSGFYYMIKTDQMTVMTGKGGALLYLDALVEAGLSEYQSDLLISEDGDKFYHINDIKLTKIKDE